MKNEEVLKKYLKGEKAQTPKRSIPNGCFTYEGRTLQTDGEKLINYKTIISYKKGDKIYINTSKYSVTTTKIQGKLNYLASQYYKSENIIYYKEI
ncbi:MAG: hypothetical protein U0L26_12725 [Cellulosilyticum sp.]|nr:hypothetical protein [Cellulosilyticum sp.]